VSIKSTSELSDYYYKQLFPILEKLEEDRKSIRSKIIITFVAVFVAVIFIVNYMMEHRYHLFALFGVVVGAAYLARWIYYSITKNYVSEFKAKIIRPLIKSIDRSFKYLPDHYLSEDDFVDSQIFPRRPDRSNGNDYISGRVDGVKIEFSDYHAEIRSKSSDNGNSYSTMFQGLFMVSEFNKEFKGTTIVLPDTAQKVFGDLVGGWLQSKSSSMYELVKMDDPSFEKKFVVYATDQIEARYILTHSLMQRILKLKNKTGSPLYVSFTNNKLYLAIEYNKDLFEPTIFSSLLQYKNAVDYAKTLHLAFNIVQDLKLNEKLWSKS